jgi:sugar lactone lactonase YvrE
MPGPSLKPLAGTVSTLMTLTDSRVHGLGFDGKGSLYVASTRGIRRYAPGAHVGPLTTDGSWEIGRDISKPAAIAVASDGSLWAISYVSHRLHWCGPDGVVKSFDLPGMFDASAPGLAVDAAGQAYVSINRGPRGMSDRNNHYILKVSRDGAMAPFAGQPDVAGGYLDAMGQAARFDLPGALAFDRTGNLYVADRGNLAIRRVTPDGQVSTVAGKGRPSLPPSPMPGWPSPDLAPYYEGTVNATGLTLDPAGTLYFTSPDNRLHRITRTGEQSVLAGDGLRCKGPQICNNVCPTPEPETCFRDGPAETARFDFPGALISDEAGVLYVMDGGLGNGRHIRRVE